MRATVLAALLLVFTPCLSSAQEVNPDLVKRARQHKKDVRDIRALDFREEVEVGVYSKKELVDFLHAEMDREFPRERCVSWQKALAHFRLIPDDLDLYDALLELYSGSIAGFYHPETKELRLIKPGEEEQGEAEMLKAMGIDVEAITFVHELCHAAQDQHFELALLPMDDETNDDLLNAMKGVIEGDASIVGWKYGLGERFELAMGAINQGYKQGTLPGKAGQLPRYLRQSLTFPYGYGTDFVLEYIRKFETDPSRADDLLRRLPTSTEQILHPEKYSSESPDWPTLLEVEKLRETAGTSSDPIVNNVHGEFGVRLLLRELRSGRRGTQMAAAEGWDGDRYYVFEENGETYSLWLTTWDSEEDAKEFFDAYLEGMGAKYEKHEEKKTSPDRAHWILPKGGTLLILRERQDVLVLDNVPENVGARAEAILKAARRTELMEVPRKDRPEWVCPKHPAHGKEAEGKCEYCGAELRRRGEDRTPPRKEYP